MKAYIYQIECLKNNKSYIGQTKNFHTRQNRHLNNLRKNKHENPKLQAAFNKYGENEFHWRVWEFEVKEQEELNQLEKDYIKKFNSFYDGFNLTEGGDNPPNRQILSDEVISYCICVGLKYENCGHSIEQALNMSRNFMAPLLRKERGLNAWELYNTYTNEQKEYFADKYYKQWNIEQIKLERLSNRGSINCCKMAQEDYNNCYAAQELGYGYSCVGKAYGLNPVTVKDWFSLRSRKSNKEKYNSLSDEEKQRIKDNLPIELFQSLENNKERLLRKQKEAAVYKSRN